MTRLRTISITRTIMAALLAAAPFPVTALMTASAHAARPPAAVPPSSADLASACAGHDGWTDPAPPAQIFANTWFVGTCGISAILVTGEEGHVLIDGGMAQAAPQVLANIARLGFRAKDVRWILSSHEHHDHAGALAALQRATGAQIAAMASEKAVLETGKPTSADPQFGSIGDFTPIKVARTLADGDSVVTGKLVITAHATPAHAPGSTSWTWQACDAKFTCRMIAYADSATAISADGYRFTDHPDRVASVREGLARIGALPCDLLLTPHPSASAMMDRFAGKAPLVDPAACARYAAAAQANFDKRLESEKHP